MDTSLEFVNVTLRDHPPELEDIRQLLMRSGLELDRNIELFVVAYAGRQMVACAGLNENIIKCVAIAPEYRGYNVCTRLISEVTHLAADRGCFHLFLYTKPENISYFLGCNFYLLVELPEVIALMENTPVGISHYCHGLSQGYHPGKKIGSIVMNANPFTRGHAYLAERAAAECDWLHLFVVFENVAMFSSDDRFALVQQGVAHIPNVTVHSASCYAVSKVTFPSYFLKKQSLIDKAFTGIDLLLFRQYIAPSLKITHRFVGSEPYCPVTRKYNADMKYWLQRPDIDLPRIEVVEVARKASDSGLTISASAVRALLKQHQFNQVKEMVPETTWCFLQEKYLARECHENH